MGRKPRAQLPGAPFHLIARTQGRAPLFRDLEGRIAGMLADAADATQTSLLAYAVMPNHMHILAVQGAEPLSRMMQLLLRRVALLVHRRHATTGHAFERRYRDHPCLDAVYLRNVIAYIHLNPVRAGLCHAPEEYEWTSHREYCLAGDVVRVLSPEQADAGLQLYAAARGMHREDLVRAYQRFLGWRLAADAYATDVDFLADDGRLSHRPPPPPPADAGDQHWWERWGLASTNARGILIEAQNQARRPDLAAIARAAIQSTAPDLPLDAIRCDSRQPAVARTRREVIRRCAALGYRNFQIARFLRISPSTVSRIRSTQAAQSAQG